MREEGSEDLNFFSFFSDKGVMLEVPYFNKILLKFAGFFVNKFGEH